MIPEDTKNRIGTSFELPKYPDNLPVITEIDLVEGIIYNGNKIGRVNWKEGDFLKSIIFENSNITVIGCYREVRGNGNIYSKFDTNKKLICVGEWIEIDKNNKIKHISFYGYYGEKVVELFRIADRLYTRIFSPDRNYKTQEEEFIPVAKRKKVIC